MTAIRSTRPTRGLVTSSAIGREQMLTRIKAGAKSPKPKTAKSRKLDRKK